MRILRLGPLKLVPPARSRWRAEIPLVGRAGGPRGHEPARDLRATARCAAPARHEATGLAVEHGRDGERPRQRAARAPSPQASGPTALWRGFCAGGLVALELTLDLLRAGM